MTKRELLKNLKEHIYCRVGISKIHGVGVIAIRNIPKGINPFVGSCQCEGVIFKKKELMNLDTEVRKMIDDFYVTEGEKVIMPSCGLNKMDISYFMNHASDSNVTTEDGNIFRTVRVIKKGEELTWDYNKYTKDA